MAVYFTFAIECYQEEDASCLAERLRTHVIQAVGHEVPMARVDVTTRDSLWYVWATPQGPGYSDFGYGEGLNEPDVIDAIVEDLYGMIVDNAGVRRAMCGYEGQDALAGSFGESNLDDCDACDLIYDRRLGPPRPNAQKFGKCHYRNAPLSRLPPRRALIRRERAGEEAAIEAVTREAFLQAEHTNHREEFIVEGLRRAGALTLSLVAELNQGIVGHVAASPVMISDGTTGWYGLGPVSVLPEHQRQGIGFHLVWDALVWLRLMGAGGCVVLGAPRLYERFGFRTTPGLVLPGVPPECFMALAFGEGMPQGIVAYHAAFEG